MTIRDRIALFVAKEFMDGQDADGLADELDLLDAGIVDSLGLLKLVAFFEEQLQVAVEPEAMVPENFASIGAMLKLAGAGSAA
jgi:acyl carrier protein